MNINQNISLSFDAISKALTLAQADSTVKLQRPIDFEYHLWQSIKDAVKPHLYGTMPKIVELTYKHETQGQKEYRKTVYRSKSHDLLMRSIQDIHKIAQSDDFIVDYDDTVAGLLSRTVFGKDKLGSNSIKTVFGTIYKDRVLDPNGYIGLEVENYDDNSPGEKTYEVKIYPSETIVAASESLMVFAIGANLFRAYTRNSTFLFDGQGAILGTVFGHNSGELGCYILGGVAMDIETNSKSAQYNSILNNEPTKVVEVQMSDYSYAIPELDRLENRNSQNEVVTTLHVYPRMVVRDMGCDSCDGLGQVQQLDINNVAVVNAIIDNGSEYFAPVMISCQKCKGKGVLDIGTQDVISVPMPSGPDALDGNKTALQDLGNSIIAYISPEINSAKFLYDQLLDSVANAKEMLRLQRFEDFGESGAAKRIDQEAGQPRLRAIAEGLQTLIKNLLNALVKFQFNTTIRSSTLATALASINVSIPSFFDLVTVGESKAMYFENIDKKALAERYLEQKKIIKKQHSSPIENRIFELSYFYTSGANLLMQNELINYKSIGVLTTEGVYVASFIDSVIRSVISKAAERLQAIDILNVTKEDFAILIDAELAPALAKLQVAQQTQTDAMNSLNNMIG